MREIVCSNIEVTYLLKKKKQVEALKGLSITFPSGVINVIFGQNGCGKTTLLNCITGLIGYDGDILIDGTNAAELTVQERHISYVRQQLVLQPKLTIFDNIAFSLKNQKLPTEEIIKKVYDVLKLFKISHLMNCLPRQISIGQQQKVCLAKAIVSNPKILILDESFSNIDVDAALEIQKVIKDYTKENDCITIYIGHDAENSLRFGDNFYIIDNSQVLYSGSKEGISKNKILEMYKDNEDKKEPILK